MVDGVPSTLRTYSIVCLPTSSFSSWLGAGILPLLAVLGAQPAAKARAAVAIIASAIGLRIEVCSSPLSPNESQPHYSRSAGELQLHLHRVADTAELDRFGPERALAFRRAIPLAEASVSMVALFSKLFPISAEVRSAQALYSAVIEQSRRTGFFTTCGVPDSANGRFEVLALNLFLVMHRLRAAAGCFRLARALSEQAVTDIDRNLREMGVGDLSVGRKVKQLTQSLYGRYGAYAAGLEGDEEILAAALRRNLFAGDEADPLALAAVADYLRREAVSLETQPDGAFQEGRVVFGLVPGERSEL